ncbi:MAG: protein-glutamate O-methyltransferase CheR [Exilibacterium sp.]
MANPTITDREFNQFRNLIYDIAGITLSDAKKLLVSSRLVKRLLHHGLSNYGDYFRILQDCRFAGELQIAVDLLTTNETYFFREPKHFDFIREQVLAQHSTGRPLRAWSAACSSGEEAYTLAMVMADTLSGGAWEILASDISTRMLDRARSGHYALERTDGISREHLRRYCLKGIGSQQGTLLIDRRLRERVCFEHINLNEPLPQVGLFDIILLRNVMIYFDSDTKNQVLGRLCPALRPCGFFIVSHTENLNGLNHPLQSVKPSIYRKPPNSKN